MRKASARMKSASRSLIPFVSANVATVSSHASPSKRSSAVSGFSSIMTGTESTCRCSRAPESGSSSVSESPGRITAQHAAATAKANLIVTARAWEVSARRIRIRGLLSLGGAGALQRMENGADTAPHGDAARPRMSLLSAKRKHQSVEPKAKTQRWRTSQQAEDYMSLVADMMAPSVTFGAYGYDHEQVPRIVAPATQPRAITAA